MIRAMLLAIAAWSGSVAGESYGYISVRVLQTNPNHTFLVSLSTNGQSIGQTFSHASSGFPWTAIGAKNLNPTGSTTALAAVYPELEKRGCEFKYEVYFAYSPKGSGISLGIFHAPSSLHPGNLPLGLKCAHAKPGTVCSNNPELQNRLNRAQTEQRMRDYDAFKAEFDSRMNEELEAAKLAQAEADSLLSQKLNEPPPWPALGADQELQDFLNQAEESLQAEMKGQAEQSAAEMEALLERGEDLAEALEPVIQQNEREALRSAIDSHRAELVASGLGAYALIMHDLDNVVDEALEQQRHFHETLVISKHAEAEELLAVQSTIANLQWTRRQILHGDAFIRAAKDGARFTPVGDAVDLCEVTTGREFCTGEALSSGDRFLAAISVFIGSRVLWKSIVGKLDRSSEIPVQTISSGVDKLALSDQATLAFSRLVERKLVDADLSVADHLLTSIRRGQFVGHQLIVPLQDDATLIIRRDVGPQAHTIRSHGPGKIDHYNFEIHVRGRSPLRSRVIFNYHAILDADGKVIHFGE